MWEPQCLTTIWAFTACYRDSFTKLHGITSQTTSNLIDRIILEFDLRAEYIDIYKSRYNDIRLQRLNSVEEWLLTILEFVRIIVSSNILHILYAVVCGFTRCIIETFCFQDRR
jgi:hypothetical protein